MFATKFEAKSRVADLLARLDAIRKQKADKVTKGDERRAKIKTLIASGGYDDPEKTSELTTLHVQLQMLPAAIQRDEEQEAALMAELHLELYTLACALSDAYGKIEEEHLKDIRKTLAKYIDAEEDGLTLDRVAQDVLRLSALRAAFYVHCNYTSIPTRERLEEQARVAIKDFDRLTLTLKRHADRFSRGFAPLPASESEFAKFRPANLQPFPGAAEGFTPEPWPERTVSPVIARQAAERAARQAE